MSSRTSSRSTLTTVPSTMSPSLKYLMVSSIAARNASSEPMSSTATLAEVEAVSVLLVMWAVAPVDWLSCKGCHTRKPSLHAPATTRDQWATSDLGLWSDYEPAPYRGRSLRVCIEQLTLPGTGR